MIGPLGRRLSGRTWVALGAAAMALTSCGGGSSKSTPPVVVVTPAPTSSPGAACSSAMVASAGGGRLGARSSPASPDAWLSPDRLYVSYRAAAADTRVTQSLDAAVHAVQAMEIGGQAGGIGHRAITLPAGTDINTAVATLRRNPAVIDVARTHLRRPTATGPVASLPANDAVNDPYSDNVDQWYLYRTNANPGAWTTTTGSSQVEIAIIDTGIDMNNQDLAGKVTHMESVLNGVVTAGTSAAQDTNGHGTNVAGLAAAATNNSYGFASVGYTTKLQAYRIFPATTPSDLCPSADTADEAKAIADAVANGASVINLSLGAPQSAGSDPAEAQAIANAIAAGVTVVAAGGNEYGNGTADGNQPDYPGGYPNVISVGASAVFDSAPNNYGAITSENVASYSNSNVTLLAPGGDASGQNDNDYLHWIEGYDTTTAGDPSLACSNSGGVCRALFNGTSQATPQVSATIALMMAEHNAGSPARSLSPAQVTSLLKQSADVLPNVDSARQGAGRLDVSKAVAAAHP